MTKLIFSNQPLNQSMLYTFEKYTGITFIDSTNDSRMTQRTVIFQQGFEYLA